MSYPQKQGPPTVIYVTTTTGQPMQPPPPPVAGPTTTKWRNQPQTNATATGGIIFLSGGMNLALGVGWADMFNLYGSTKHFFYSWFIAVIIGTVLSALLRIFLPKRVLMGASTLLIAIGGILFISDPYGYDVLCAGRYVNGIAIGLAIVPFLLNASEIAADAYRGSCLAVEQYSFSMGIAIQMIYASSWSYTYGFPANRLHGILDIIYALMAAISLFKFKESPIDYIRKGNDGAAMTCLAQLRRPEGFTTETQAWFDQHKAYVREDESLTLVKTLEYSVMPWAKMLFMRSIMLAFSYSMPLTLALQYSIVLNGNTWAPIAAAICRIFGGIIAICLADGLGRKLPSVISALFIGVFLIIISTFFSDLENVNYEIMNSAMYLIIFMQLFVGFFTPYTSIYMGEAFPLRTKPYIMDLLVIIEQILQIILIVTINVYLSDSLLSQGIIVTVGSVLLFVSMPETRNTSLAEAQRRFRNFVNVRSS